MQLHYFGILILTLPVVMPTIADPISPKTFGVLSVHARFLVTPCQPKLSTQHYTNYANVPRYRFTLNFDHCRSMEQKRSNVPFSIKLRDEKHILAPLSLNNGNYSFSSSSNQAIHRLEIKYD